MCTNLGEFVEYQFSSPLCDERRLYSNKLAKLAMYGIAFHELAHIVLGHLHVLENHSVPPIGIQAMEWSADVYAAKLLAQACSGRSSAGMDAVFRSLAVMLSTDRETWMAGHSERTHPSPHHRIVFAMQTIGMVAAEQGFKWELRGRDAVDLILAHNHITGNTADIEYVIYSFKNPDLEPMEYWQREMSSLAEPYALVPLPTGGPYDDDLYR